MAYNDHHSSLYLDFHHVMVEFNDKPYTWEARTDPADAIIHGAMSFESQ